jgi:hypothetical protein
LFVPDFSIIEQFTSHKLAEVQAKDIGNIFNKIIAENFPNLEKVVPI